MKFLLFFTTEMGEPFEEHILLEPESNDTQTCFNIFEPFRIIRDTKIFKII